jgi:hypothetical protein
MSRATQWQPRCEADPTSGEADEVERAGWHYKAMAEEIDAQVARLKNIVASALLGASVQTLTDAADGLGDALGWASGRYREIGGTLEKNISDPVRIRPRSMWWDPRQSPRRPLSRRPQR